MTCIHAARWRTASECALRMCCNKKVKKKKTPAEGRGGKKRPGAFLPIEDRHNFLERGRGEADKRQRPIWNAAIPAGFELRERGGERTVKKKNGMTRTYPENKPTADSKKWTYWMH